MPCLCFTHSIPIKAIQPTSAFSGTYYMRQLWMLSIFILWFCCCNSIFWTCSMVHLNLTSWKLPKTSLNCPAVIQQLPWSSQKNSPITAKVHQELQTFQKTSPKCPLKLHKSPRKTAKVIQKQMYFKSFPNLLQKLCKGSPKNTRKFLRNCPKVPVKYSNVIQKMPKSYHKNAYTLRDHCPKVPINLLVQSKLPIKLHKRSHKHCSSRGLCKTA